MSMTDPVADLLTRLRNAIHARQAVVHIPYSQMKYEMIRILKEEGYIENYVLENSGVHRDIKILLRYRNKYQSPISVLKRISRPGCRVYCDKGSIPEVLGGLGINIVTTSRGIMSGRKARENGVGGELLCEVS
jgi:small subunit ribosomal protein S8